VQVLPLCVAQLAMVGVSATQQQFLSPETGFAPLAQVTPVQLATQTPFLR